MCATRFFTYELLLIKLPFRHLGTYSISYYYYYPYKLIVSIYEAPIYTFTIQSHNTNNIIQSIQSNHTIHSNLAISTVTKVSKLHYKRFNNPLIYHSNPLILDQYLSLFLVIPKKYKKSVVRFLSINYCLLLSIILAI